MTVHEVALPELLRRLEAEMSRIESLARGLEVSVGDMIDASSQIPDQARSALQDIDLVVQTSGDLRAFLSRLALSPTEETRLRLEPALQATKLARVRAALSGAEDLAANQTSEESFF